MNSNNYDDEVVSYLNIISRKFTDLKNELKISKDRIRHLEIENEKLREKLSIEYTETKKRKLSSLDQSSFLNHTSADQSGIVGINDTLNSLGQADEFNVAIQDISSRTDNEVEIDEEEISATPVAPTSVIKRERFKTTLKDPTPKPLEPTRRNTFEQTPVRKLNTTTELESVQIKSEGISSTKDPKSSPLRRIENDISLWSSSPGSGSSSWISAKCRAIKQESRPFDGEDSRVSTKSTDPEENVKSERKSLSLASRKFPRLRQSMLNFSVEKVKRNFTANDLDETYCDDLISQQKAKRKEIDENLFDFKQTSVKQEPNTQKHERLNHNSTSERMSYYANSSSVFALPSQTDEIVIVEDSEPMFTSQDLKPEPDEKDGEPCIRTDYKQRVDVRTLKDKAAQPGFMCPDCAPWFKYIGAGLSDREIQRRLDQCSRHRQNQELPATPEGFWVPYFVETQEEDKEETLVHYRLKSKEQIVNEKLNK